VGRRLRLAFLLVGLTLFCFLVWRVGLGNVVTHIREMGWWFLPVIGVWGIGYVFNTASWRFVLGDAGEGMSFGELYRMTVTCFALNYATPFVTLGGEAYRAVAIKDRTGKRAAVSTVLLYRMIHTLAQLIFWLLTLVLVLFFFPIDLGTKMLLGGVFLVLAAVISLLFLAHRFGMVERIMRVILKLPAPESWKKKLLKREEAIVEIDSKIRDLYHSRRRAFYLALSFELLFRFVISTEFYFILRAMGQSVSILDAIYISAAMSLIVNLLFFIPFELGSREGALYLIMEGISISSGLGVYAGLVTRIRELCWIGIGLVLLQFSGERARLKQAVELKMDDRQ
jgi:uncharacterized membrane protein YbhN (UPF0104 family)